MRTARHQILKLRVRLSSTGIPNGVAQNRWFQHETLRILSFWALQILLNHKWTIPPSRFLLQGHLVGQVGDHDFWFGDCIMLHTYQPGSRKSEQPCHSTVLDLRNVVDGKCLKHEFAYTNQEHWQIRNRDVKPVWHGQHVALFVMSIVYQPGSLSQNEWTSVTWCIIAWDSWGTQPSLMAPCWRTISSNPYSHPNTKENQWRPTAHHYKPSKHLLTTGSSQQHATPSADPNSSSLPCRTSLSSPPGDPGSAAAPREIHASSAGWTPKLHPRNGQFLRMAHCRCTAKNITFRSETVMNSWAWTTSLWGNHH